MKNTITKTFALSSIGLVFCLNLFGQSIENKNLTQLVDPFIGVDGSGNVLLGATLPFGMVKLSPDCDFDTNSGYVSGKDISGFSHTHVSGTGGGPKYGNILIMATTGDVDIINHASPKTSEIASPGYYGVTLSKYNVQAEHTTTMHTGFHQYTFPASDKSNIIIDAGSFLGHNAVPGEAQSLVGSEVNIFSNNEIEGYSRIRGGWNGGDAYTVYFYAKFETPASAFGTWKGSKISMGNKSEYDSGEKTGAYFTFKTKNKEAIRLKVGISYISCLKAKANLEKENPGWDFNKVKLAANEVWNKSLNSIIVEGGSPDQNKTFYTALYHSMLMPTDITGENPKWKSSEPCYDDYYAIWDTFRSSHPLLSLILESKQVDMVRSLIDIFEHEGYMPDARSGNDNGRTQGGSDCDMLIADAYVKGLKGIDYEKAYQAMIKNAEVAPGGDERKEGRGGISDYNKLGYVSIDFERSGNRTVEYANNDWAIAQVAKGLGETEDYKKYKKRASNWQNLWRPCYSHGAKGFIWPRNADATWADSAYIFSWTENKSLKGKFTEFTGGTWPDVFYESHSWEYSFYVPQDVKTLIEKCGGKAAFISRLDTFFTNNYYNVGNEPGFLTPVLYNYVGRPDKTAFQVNRIRHASYNATRRGLPGNDDSGAMSSFFVFHSLGFFPNAGQDIYLISTPLFSKSILAMENGKQITITAKNLSDKNIFIQSATLNGKPFNKSWFRHSDIKDGASFEFIMGNQPSAWSTTSTLPPSMSDFE